MIYLFRTEDENEMYYQNLMLLKQEAREYIQKGNLQIDRLIRKDLITVDMASSLVNDTDNVNDMIKKLITVAELLYSRKDTILENQDSKKV